MFLALSLSYLLPSPLPQMTGLFRGRKGIYVLAAAMLVFGTLNTIATKLQVRDLMTTTMTLRFLGQPP